MLACHLDMSNLDMSKLDASAISPILLGRKSLYGHACYIRNGCFFLSFFFEAGNEIKKKSGKVQRSYWGLFSLLLLVPGNGYSPPHHTTTHHSQESHPWNFPTNHASQFDFKLLLNQCDNHSFLWGLIGWVLDIVCKNTILWCLKEEMADFLFLVNLFRSCLNTTTFLHGLFM